MTAQKHVHLPIKLRPCASHDSVMIQLMQPFSNHSPQTCANHVQTKLKPRYSYSSYGSTMNNAPVMYRGPVSVMYRGPFQSCTGGPFQSCTGTRFSHVQGVRFSHVQGPVSVMYSGPFLEGPETFSHPKSRSKISNLMIAELFYSHILYTTRSSLHTRSFTRVHLSVFRDRLAKNGFAGPKRFQGFRETSPCPE